MEQGGQDESLQFLLIFLLCLQEGGGKGNCVLTCHEVPSFSLTSTLKRERIGFEKKKLAVKFTFKQTTCS